MQLATLDYLQQIPLSYAHTHTLNWTFTTSGGHLNGSPVRGLGRHVKSSCCGGSNRAESVCMSISTAPNHIYIYSSPVHGHSMLQLILRTAITKYSHS